MRIVAQQPKFMVRLKQRQPAPSAPKPRPLLQAGALPRSATPFEVVAHQVESRIRLRAFEEHGTDDARMDEPGDIDSGSTTNTKIEEKSNTPFLDLFYGRRFRLPVESLPGAAESRSNEKSHSYTESGKAKTNEFVRLDYYLFRLFLRAITPKEFAIPNLYFDNKKAAGGVPLIEIFKQSAVKDNWRNLKVIKTARSFIVDLPIVTVERELLLTNLATILNYSSTSRAEGYLKTAVSDESGALTIDTENGYIFPVAEFTRDESKGFPAAELKYLTKADASVVVFNYEGVGLSAVLRISCSRKEAEYLLRQSFTEARPVDLFNLLMGAVQPKLYSKIAISYDTSVAPTCGFSLAKIARSLPEDSESMRRTNEDDIVIDSDGDFFFLPKKLNNVPYYDETWNNVVDPEYTGTTAYAGGPDWEKSGDAPVQKKLSNIGSIPVLIDWQNCKFAYTNTNGALNVLDLDQVYTARAMHYTRFLREPIESARGKTLISEIPIYLNIVGIDARSMGFPDSPDYISTVANSLGYFSKEDRARLPILAIPYTAKEYYEPDTADEFESRNGIYDPLSVSRRALGGDAANSPKYSNSVVANKQAIQGSVGVMACARALLEKLENEPERFYRERAVTSVYSLRARLTVFLKGLDLDGLFERARVEQDKYVKQSVDPNFKMEALPLISTDKDGIKPQFHQENCLNLTKDNPDNVIYPVAAGGGKCATSEHIVVTDKGLVSLGEIYRNSGDEIGNTGFRELSGVKVMSSIGMTAADKSYRTKGKTIRVNFTDGSYFEGLPEHRMWATTDGQTFDYVRLDKLTPSHSLEKRIGLNVYGTRIKLPKLDCSELSDRLIRKAKVDKVKIPTIMTEDLATLIGYLVSEGVIRADFGHVELTNTDPEVIAQVENCYNKVFGENSYTKSHVAPRKVGHKDAYIIRAKGITKAFLLQILPSAVSDTVEIPLCIRRAPKNIQIAFLRALFEGDGSVYIKSHGRNDKGYANSWVVDYTTISNNLCIQLKAVLENMGIMCTVRTRAPYSSAQGNNGAEKTKRAYTITINYRHFEEFSQIGFAASRKKELFEQAHKDAISASKNVVNKNALSQGIFNKFFFNGSRSVITHVLRTILESSEYKKQALSDNLTVIQLTHKLFAELGLSIDSYRGFVNAEYTDKLSKHAVDQINKFIESNLHLVPKKLRVKYANLVSAFSKYWIQPTTTEWSTVEKPVYDISVPGPHDYVVNSLLSHNTILAIVDILRQIDRGEKGPFIIACPAGLVPDYVAEISYATAGKINPIAITTDVWETHERGLKGSLRSIVKSAPINTIIVVAYRTLTLGSYDVCYGQEIVTVYPVIQFLRSFRPTYAFFDECHTLRTKTSKTRKAALRLMAGCKKKRLASGTMVANTLQDIVGQISLIDPTLFGSEDDFRETYMEVVEGTRGKKRKPRPGAETAVKNLLFSNMVIAGADRKQWAYKLPKQKRSFLAVEMTPLQQVTHDFILEAVFKDMAPKVSDDDEAFVKALPGEKDDVTARSQDRLAASIVRSRARAAERIAKGHKLYKSTAVIPDSIVDDEGNVNLKGLVELARINQGKNSVVEPSDEVEEEDDEDKKKEKKPEGLNYLSIVETFISGPEDYEALMAYVSNRYNVPFLESDLSSPKVDACISRIREHLQNTPQGKFIVFCNYNATREAIIRALPEDIKKVTINYMAEQKLTQRKEFVDNDEIRGLIGIEKSLSTGFNLQVGTRLIRVETVWTPADIEQGDSRINRPSVKKGEVRDRIYYDTIIADDSLDVAKVASLVSKKIAQIKFDQTEAVSLDDVASTVKQTENPFFALETPDPFNLSPQGILDNCNVQEMNARYLVPLETVSKMLERTYAQFALDNKEKMFANPEIIQEAQNPEDTIFPKELIKKEKAIVEKAPPPGSFIMYRIPYTLGMELYKADALGLVPYKKWLEEMGFSKFRDNLGLTSSYRPGPDIKFGSPAYAAGLKAHTAALLKAEKDFVQKHKPRIHTDLGDGVLETARQVNLAVRMSATGYLEGVKRNKAFVITRTYTNVQDIRQALISNSKLPIKDANMRDMTPVPLEKLIQEEQSGRTKVRPTAPVQRPAAPVVPKPPVEVVDENAIPVSVVSINGYPSIQVDADLFKVADKKFVAAHPYGNKMHGTFGYKPAARTLYLIKPRDGADLAKAITLLEKNGFVIPPILRSRLLDLRDHVAGGQGLIKKLEHMKLPALTAEYTAFLAKQNNMQTEDGKDKLAIFPYIVDGNNFQFMLTKSAATEKAIATIRESSLAPRVTIAARAQTKAAKVFNTIDEAEEDLVALFEGKMIDKGTYESQLKKLSSLQTVTPAEKLTAYKPRLPEYAATEESKKPTKPAVEKPAEVAPQKPTAPAQPAATKPQAPQPAGKIDAEGEIISYSSFYGVEIKAETPEQVAALTELGFHKSSLRYVVVRTLQQFREVARACSSNGYALPPENRAALMRVNKLWSSHPNPDDLLDFSSKRHTQLQVDREMKFKVAHPEKDHVGNSFPKNTKFVFAIPIVTDTEVRFAVPNVHQDSVDALVSVVKPITNTPIKFDNKNKYILLCEDIPDLYDALKQIDGVFNLINRAEMIKQYREIKASTN